MILNTTLPRLRRALFALPPAILLFAAPAHAAEEDVQVWLYYNTVVPLGDDTKATIEISPRWRRDDPDMVLTRATVEVDVSPSFTVGAGAAYIEFAGGSEYRPHQQISFDAGPLSFRTRLEERFFENSPRPAIRLRQRVATSVPLGEHTELTANVEYLHNLRSDDPEEEPGTESWRWLFGVQQDLSDDFTLEVNYHLILTPREDAPDQLSHIPRMTLTHRF